MHPIKVKIGLRKFIFVPLKLVLEVSVSWLWSSCSWVSNRSMFSGISSILKYLCLILFSEIQLCPLEAKIKKSYRQMKVGRFRVTAY